MPTYLYQVAYTSDAWSNMIRSPQDRIAAVTPAIRALGGKVIAGYWAFGEYDLVAIIEMPDNASAASFSIAAASGGAVSKLHTTPLMTMRDGMDAMKKAQSSTYRPPAAKSAAKAAKKASRR
jgi:uncharacterized protein with GYD domain